MRSHIAACQTVHLPHSVIDIFRYAAREDPDHRQLVERVEAETPAAGIRVFHVNADEVEPVIDAFERRGGDFSDGYNIIVPAWELPRYPAPWAEKLRKFNEVWALSRFIADGLHRLVSQVTMSGKQSKFRPVTSCPAGILVFVNQHLFPFVFKGYGQYIAVNLPCQGDVMK